MKFPSQFWQRCHKHIHTKIEPPQICSTLSLNFRNELKFKWKKKQHSNAIACAENVFCSTNRQTTKTSNILLHFCLFLTLFWPQTAALTYTKILACHFHLCVREFRAAEKRTGSKFFQSFSVILLCFITVFWTVFVFSVRIFVILLFVSFSLPFDYLCVRIDIEHKIDCCRCWLSECRSYQNIWPINLLVFPSTCILPFAHF